MKLEISKLIGIFVSLTFCTNPSVKTALQYKYNHKNKSSTVLSDAAISSYISQNNSIEQSHTFAKV